MLSLLNRLADQRIDDLSKEILQAVKQQDKVIAFGVITSKLTALVEQVYEAEIHNLLLSLDFTTRTGREASIEEAYGRTFEWIFSETESSGASSHGLSFVNWLKRGKGVFWISGKAGSGKSTLIRYILNEPRTLRILRTWGSNQKLIIASYFFFDAGDSLQKSQQGLIRSILFDILSQCPDLIPTLAPARLHDHYLRSRPWKTDELRDVCRGLTEQSIDIRFCFFVDGLDEYEGEHRDVINILNDLATLPNIKLCVSSRPWNVFQNSFGPLGQQLVLEEHTENDIVLYVKERLGNDQSFASSAREDPRLRYLITQIIGKAQGVFLWVRLMVSDLLRGSANQDDIRDLQQRLRYLPPNLETYYNSAFDNIDKFYREITAEILLLAQEAAQPLSLLTIVFYEIEKQHNSDWLRAYRATASEAKVDALLEACQTRLNSRCQDFLVVRSSQDTEITLKHTVEFLHATAAEFLRRPEMRAKLEGWVSDGFNPRLTLFRATLAQISLRPSYRRFKPGASTFGPKSFHILVSQFLEYAYHLEKHDHSCDIALLDEFDRAAQRYYSLEFLSGYGTGYSHWAGFYGATQNPDPILPHSWNDFLTVAIQHDLQMYVTGKLEKQHELLHRSSAPPLLYYALAMHTSKIARPYLRPRDSAVMVQILLKHGAQPHEHFHLPPRDQDMTVFGVFLGQLYKEHRQGSSTTREIFETCKTLIEHGSDLRLHTWDIPLFWNSNGAAIDYRLPTSTVFTSLFSSSQVALLNKASNKGRLAIVLSWLYWLKYNVHPIIIYLLLLWWLWIVISELGKLLQYSATLISTLLL
jgi:hypothetical protein